jgi:hypothetical protein
MTQVDTFAYSKMWMDVATLDVKGNLKFIMVTSMNLVQGTMYQIEINLSPRLIIKYDKLLSVLKFDGSTLAISSSSNTTTDTLISFVFTPGTNKKVWEWELSEFYVFQDKFTASITLSKELSGVYHQSVTTGGGLSL